MKIDYSDISLLLSNLFVIILALVQGWSLVNLMLVYWGQSVVIGFFNFLKILNLKDFSTKGFRINDKPVKPSEGIKTFVALFFLVHYGGFHIGYLFFIAFPFSLITLNDALPSIDFGFILLSVIIFFINHLFSYFYNDKRNQVVEGKNILNVMFYPYARIIPMHLVAMFGFLLPGLTGLVMFFGLKTVADLLMHKYEHKV